MIAHQSTRRLEGVRILFVVNVDWFFLSHRLPLLEAAVAEGAVVGVAARDSGRLTELEHAGIATYPLPMTRASRSVVEMFRSTLSISRAIRSFRPHVVHNVTIKPIIFGTLAARLLAREAAVINAISGFGFALQGEQSRFLRGLVLRSYRLLFKSERVTVVVQNDGAAQEVTSNGLASDAQIELVEGAGVDCQRFRPRQTPHLDDGPIRVLMASRILRDKGVVEFCSAANQISEPEIQATLAGSLDPQGNPTALTAAEVETLCESTGVNYIGEIEDMPRLLSESDIFVLPSYHEGLPKVLLEAAACGLPLVATDIPGNRPVVHHGVNGELVPVAETGPLAEAIARLAADGNLRERYGTASRETAVRRFAVEKVAASFVDMYARKAKA